MARGWEKPAETAMGAPARSLWRLQAGATFLNHGSFGACPRLVLAEQDRLRRALERHPDRFFDTRIVPRPGGTPLRAAAEMLAAFLGAAGERLAFVENATEGVQAVLGSVALSPGDEVLITDHQYNAVRAAAADRCQRAGAKLAVAPIPIAAGAPEIVERIAAAATARTRLAIIDAITSATARRFPVEAISAELKRRGTRVLIDAAHAPGQIGLDIERLGADWLTGNAHKWLYAPKGCGFLWASAQAAPLTRPLVTSHFAHLRFPQAFDYVGTRDYTGWLALPAAVRFWRALGPDRVKAWTGGLITHARHRLTALGASPTAPEPEGLAMAAFVLPTVRPATAEDAIALRENLWRGERIQIAAGVLGEALLVRISAQAYVAEADIDQLAEALERRGWPGRGGA